MTTIKLNNYYPHLTECVTLEVSEEIAVTLSIGGRMCDSYKRRKRDHDECSLDGTPGFEADVTYPPLTPEEIMELAEDRAALYAALDRLPPVQARRVYAHYIQGATRLGLACLATAQTFLGAAAPFMDRNGIPCWPLDSVNCPPSSRQ